MFTETLSTWIGDFINILISRFLLLVINEAFLITIYCQILRVLFD